MGYVPMCVMCGEWEVSTFQSHDDFCSDRCADAHSEYLYEDSRSYEDKGSYEYDTDGVPVDTQGWE